MPQSISLLLDAVLALPEADRKQLAELITATGGHIGRCLCGGDGGWQQDTNPTVSGYEAAQPDRAGKRLLGIRIEKHEDAAEGMFVTIALSNRGNTANGPVAGTTTLRYRARQLEKGWTVELVE